MQKRRLLGCVDEVTMWLRNGGRNNIFYDEFGEDKHDESVQGEK